MSEDLGDRMKKGYEDVFRHYLPCKSHVIIRCDGKGWHQFTKNCVRPFDDTLMNSLDLAAIQTAKDIQGLKAIYIQSDEVSFWLNDCRSLEAQPYFDNNIQKLVSVTASMLTAYFNYFFQRCDKSLAFFDSRTFIVPNLEEVANYFKFRSDDASKNSLQMVARSLYSHGELENKKTAELQEMIFTKGINWNNYPNKYKRGRLIKKVKVPKIIEIKENDIMISKTVERNEWQMVKVEDYTFNYWFGTINELNKQEIV